MVQRKITACVIDNAIGYESSFEVRIPVETLARLSARTTHPGIAVDRDSGFPTYVPNVNQFAVERLLSNVGREEYITLARYLQAVQAYDTEVAPLIEELANSLSATSTLTRDIASHMDTLSIRAVFRENPTKAKQNIQARRAETHWHTHYEVGAAMPRCVGSGWGQLQALPLWFRQLAGVQEGLPVTVDFETAMRGIDEYKFARPMLWFAINCKDIEGLARALSTASAEGFGALFCKVSNTGRASAVGIAEDVTFTLVSLRDGFKQSEVKDLAFLALINQETGGSAKPIVKANFHRRLRNTKPPKGN